MSRKRSPASCISLIDTNVPTGNISSNSVIVSLSLKERFELQSAKKNLSRHGVIPAQFKGEPTDFGIDFKRGEPIKIQIKEGA